MDSFDEAMSLMPTELVQAMERHRIFSPEEIRLRCGRQPSLFYAGKEHCVASQPVEEEMLLKILQKATGASLYQAAAALREGYYCSGTLRLGVCGQASRGTGTGFSHFTSLAVRLSHECLGACDTLKNELTRGGFRNTLILSPPGGGKTTALRNLIRLLADDGIRIGVIDERGELSSGVYDLGRCSDVISGMNKLSGALLLLRSMSPQLIAADEITAPEDIAAIEEIVGCGTALLVTAHANRVSDLDKRDRYRRLLERGIFQRAVEIRTSGTDRRYEVRELA